MYQKLLITLLGLACIKLSSYWPLPSVEVPKTVKLAKKESPKVRVKKPVKAKKIHAVAPKKIGTLNHIALMKVSFHSLPGWDNADVKKSLQAFQTSCDTFLKQSPKHPVGSAHIKLQAKDWHPACKAALLVDSNSEEKARNFFETWFHPIEFKPKNSAKGLFTGYYTPQLKGSLTRTKEFNTPIYGLPKSLTWSSHGKKRYYTREQIDEGMIKKKAPVLAWIKDPIERLFLEIEGAGVIQLNSGKKVYLGYAGENGAPYTSIGKVLINRGIMNKDNASKAAITRYLKNHPQKMNPILHKNKSFVFFQRVDEPIALGAQGTALTPGYSLAIDKKWIPLGAPLWLNSKQPDVAKDTEKRLQRLMIAQDTGGAIRGLMRGDVYWGSGKRATFLGEHMKNQGRYWLLLPKYALNKLANKLQVSRVY